MTEGRVGIGFIGCGEIAHIHSSALRDAAADGLPIDAVAAADPVADHRRAVARNLAFDRFYDTADELLDDPDVDAVWVGVPTSMHSELYARVLAAGKHLYAEKPLATDLASVQQFAAVAAAARGLTQVGFQSRFDPLLARARELVRSEAIGPTMSYLWRDDEGFPTTQLQPGRSDWRSKAAEAGGGVLLEHSIHALDVLVWTFGPVVRVSASTRHVLGLEVEDTAVVLLEHASGVVGTHVGVYGGVSEREVSRFEIQGRDAIIEITRNGVVVDAPDNTWLEQRAKAPPERIEIAEIIAEYAARHRLARAPFFLQDVADRAFVESILTGAEPSPGVDDALAAHTVIEAAYVSARERRPVELDELVPAP